MPTWTNIRERWSSYRNRLDMNTRFGQMLTGVLPTVQLERSWPGDQLDIFGLNVEAAFTGGGAAHHYACSLHNTSDDNPPEVEQLVWRINAWVWDETGTGAGGAEIERTGLHLFSPIPTYNPHAIAADIPIHAPWLQTMAEVEGAAVRLSRAHGDAGANAALQVVTIGGVPTTSLGPILFGEGRGLTITSGVGYAGDGGRMVEFMPQYPCPPIRLLPGRRLTVQTTSTMSRTRFQLQTNFWYSERLYERGS